MNKSNLEFTKRKLKLNYLERLIDEELEIFKKKCEEDPENRDRHFQIYENNIRMIQKLVKSV
jgi:hypothetical protein